MKSFSILRTNVGLTTNVKIVVDSNYNLFLDSIESNSNLSNDRYKRFRFTSKNYYDELVPLFFKKTPVDVSYDIKYDGDSNLMSNDFSNQYDEIYEYGARNIIANKNYNEEFEYFAPLYISKLKIPSHFIVFRVDGPGVELMTKENITSDVFNSFKLVKMWDLSTQTNIGKWLDVNFKKNSFFPDTPLEMDFRELEFCKWNGIDYDSGGYCSKSVFIDDILDEEKEIFELEKFIFNNYKNNKVIFPNILNFSFLFDDEPSNPDIKRKWSLNRYFGFYLDSLEKVKTISPYKPPTLKSGFQILPGNILTHKSGDPFVEGWSNSKPFYVEYDGEYYKVEQFQQIEKNKLLAIPLKEQINPSIKDRLSDRSVRRGTTGNVLPEEKKPEVLRGRASVTKTIIPRTLKEQYVDLEINKYRIISEVDLSQKESYINKNYGIINSNNELIYSRDYYVTIDDFEDYSVWLIEIDGVYHNLFSENGKIKISTDYSFNFLENDYTYKVAGNEKKVSFRVDSQNPPKKFTIYRATFTDIKDFDTRIVDTECSKYEYEKESELTETDESKFYLENPLTETNPRSLDDYIYKGDVVNIPVSSEYTANYETFKIEKGILSDIWRKNPVYCRWSFQNSLSSNDYPYVLNNSFLFEDYNRTVNPFEQKPVRSERNLDYFYTINSSTSSYIHHSLHVEGHYPNGTLDTNFKFELDKYLNLYKYTIGEVEFKYFADGVYYQEVSKPSAYYKGKPTYILTRNTGFPYSYVFWDESEVGSVNPGLFAWQHWQNLSLVSGGSGDYYGTLDESGFTPISSNNSWKTAVDENVTIISSTILNPVTVTYSLDYFTDFFYRRQYFNNGKIAKNVKKYSIFNAGDKSFPNVSLFRGLKFSIYDVDSIQLSKDREIDKINLSNSNTYDGYKLSILLSDNNQYIDKMGNLITSDNQMKWQIIEDWKMEQFYKSGDIVEYGDILYQAIVDNTTINPHRGDFLNKIKTTPYSQPDVWQFISVTGSIYFEPTKNYNQGDIIFYHDEYYSYNSSGIYTIWDPSKSSPESQNLQNGYAKNDVVLFKDKWYISNLDNNVFPPDDVIPFFDEEDITLPFALKLVKRRVSVPRLKWTEISTPKQSKWIPVPLWNPINRYPSYSTVIHNDVIYRNNNLFEITPGETPKVSRLWTRIMSYEPDTDYIYPGTNAVIKMNNKTYICVSNPNNSTLDNGINIYVNKKWKNILININVSDNTIGKLSNIDRDDIYTELYEKFTAFNFIRAMNDIDTKYGFTDYVNYIIIDENGKITKHNYSSNLSTLPCLIRVDEPDEFNVRLYSLSKTPLMNPKGIILNRKLNNGTILSLSQLNWYSDLPYAMEIEENKFEPLVLPNYHGNKNLVVDPIFRHSGYYMPVFYDIQLFDKQLDGISENTRFDTTLTEFGMMKERKIRKINRQGSLLKLRNDESNLSVYPMIDEYGYTFVDFFIFSSTWDYRYHYETVNVKTRTKFNIEIPTLKSKDIKKFGQPVSFRNDNRKNFNI